MTEAIQKRLELMTEEMEEMRRIKLFTIEETRIMFKKRKQFEHKIHAVEKDPNSYQEYIFYEKCLLKDIRLRRSKYKIGEKRNSIEHRIIRRIKSLYEVAIQRFPNDISLFLSFLKFCKQVNYVNAASDTVANMIKLHSDKPEVWKVAANWHMFDRSDVKTALGMLLKGLELHKNSQILYKEVIVIQIYNVTNNKADKDVCVNKLLGIVDAIFNAIKLPEFYIEILELLSPHLFTVEVQERVIKTLTEYYFDNENVWHALAQREFRGSHLAPDNSSALQMKVPASIEIYKEGLLKVTSDIKPKLWTLYLDFLLEVHSNQCEGDDVSSTLQDAMEEASADKCLSERFYIAWLDLVKDRSDLELHILEKGRTEFPRSVNLWTLYMHYYILRKDSENVNRVFKLAVTNLGKDALPVWEGAIQYHCDGGNLREIYEEGVRQAEEISNVLKPQYLEWLASTEGITVAREVYGRLSVAKPYCKDMHKMMSKLESMEPNPNLNEWKKVHENACHQFGKVDVNVWINYIRFYLRHYAKHDSLSIQINSLYNRAQRELSISLNAEFLRRYSEIMNNDDI